MKKIRSVKDYINRTSGFRLRDAPDWVEVVFNEHIVHYNRTNVYDFLTSIFILNGYMSISIRRTFFKDRYKTQHRELQIELDENGHFNIQDRDGIVIDAY